MPTAKYHFLKCFDWANSLIYRELAERLPEEDRLLILGQDRLNELLIEADQMNEADDYLDDPQFTAEDALLCQELLSQSVFLHYKRSRRLYTQIECEYHSQILKKKLKDGEGSLDDLQLYEIFFLGLKTLGALMTLLMLRPQWRRLEQRFALQIEGPVDTVTCVKILTRARKMYDAYQSVVRILRMLC